LSQAPLFPEAINTVGVWIESLGAANLVQENALKRQKYPKVWQLNEGFVMPGSELPKLLLPNDFPLTPVRIELGMQLCLVLPHIESDGSFCHGIFARPEDIEKPVEAVGRVLAELGNFLTNVMDPGWVEAEFHRERQDYWSRYVAAATTPTGYRTEELFIDVDVQREEPQVASTTTFGSGERALASVGASGPEAVVKSKGWAVGTIVRGSTLVVRLPANERWTPKTWPHSFEELNEFLAQVSGNAGLLTSWYLPVKDSRPFFVVLLQETAVFGWRIVPRGVLGRNQPSLVPIKVTRIDRQWCLSRDHQVDQLTVLSAKSVVVFGCGSLGGPVIELLARACVGHIDVADPDVMKSENVSRHSLGANAIGLVKVVELCSRICRDVPGARVKAFPQSAQEWLTSLVVSKAPDLVLDCTGDRTVRISTSLLRRGVLQNRPVIMAWMEPYCAAAHVVAITGEDVWPISDPAESAINVAVWPDGHEVTLPGCGQGFHPYGMADVWRVAGLVAERSIALLMGQDTKSEVWSMIRGRGFFDAVAPGIVFNRELPNGPDTESIVQRRGLQEVLDGK
jgi:hypothetical protein